MAVKTKTDASASAAAPKNAKAKTYTKEQILRSNIYKYRRDLVGALLEDGKSYEIKEVDKMIENYLKGGKQ